MCQVSNTVAEADLPNIEDGDYTFTVTAIRTISDNNPLTPDTVEEAASPPFNFRVGIGGDGGADLGDLRQLFYWKEPIWDPLDKWKTRIY